VSNEKAFASKNYGKGKRQKAKGKRQYGNTAIRQYGKRQYGNTAKSRAK